MSSALIWNIKHLLEGRERAKLCLNCALARPGMQDVTIAFLSVCQANQIQQIRCNFESELSAQAGFLTITDKACLALDFNLCSLFCSFFRTKAAICDIYTKLIDFPNEVVPSKISSEGITTVLSEIWNACNYSIVGKLITGFNSFLAASFPASKHNSEIPRSKNFSQANTGDQSNFPSGYQMNLELLDISLENQYFKIHYRVLSAANLQNVWATAEKFYPLCVLTPAALWIAAL